MIVAETVAAAVAERPQRPWRKVTVVAVRCSAVQRSAVQCLWPLAMHMSTGGVDMCVTCASVRACVRQQAHVTFMMWQGWEVLRWRPWRRSCRQLAQP